MPVKFWHTSLRFWFFLSYLITTVKLFGKVMDLKLQMGQSLWSEPFIICLNSSNFISKEDFISISSVPKCSFFWASTNWECYFCTGMWWVFQPIQKKNISKSMKYSISSYNWTKNGLKRSKDYGSKLVFFYWGPCFE